jgi:hypothetical protein
VDGADIPGSGSAASANGPEFTLVCPEFNRFRSFQKEHDYAF